MENEITSTTSGLAELLVRVERALTLAAPPHNGLSLIVGLCVRLGLTRGEARGLAKLMEDGFVSRENLHSATSHPTSRIKTVDAVVCKLRAKLKPHGVKIINIHGRGFVLDKAACAKIHQLINAHDTNNTA